MSRRNRLLALAIVALFGLGSMACSDITSPQSGGCGANNSHTCLQAGANNSHT